MTACFNNLDTKLRTVNNKIGDTKYQLTKAQRAVRNSPVKRKYA